MKNNNTNILKDLKNLLDEYMTKASLAEFIKNRAKKIASRQSSNRLAKHFSGHANSDYSVIIRFTVIRQAGILAE